MSFRFRNAMSSSIVASVPGRGIPASWLSMTHENSCCMTVPSFSLSPAQLTTELSRLVLQLFANEGIEIPYPHVQVLSSKWSVTAMVRADR